MKGDRFQNEGKWNIKSSTMQEGPKRMVRNERVF
jgi:hypothetical protein